MLEGCRINKKGMTQQVTPGPAPLTADSLTTNYPPVVPS